MINLKVLRVLILLAGVLISGNVLADRGHGHGHGSHGHIGLGLYFGAPYAYPFYPSPYYYPYSYYPPLAVVPAQPPVYIERQQIIQQAEPEASDDYYWYHCDKPEGYYPYIKECPKGWQKVLPTPPQ